MKAFHSILCGVMFKLQYKMVEVYGQDLENKFISHYLSTDHSQDQCCERYDPFIGCVLCASSRYTWF